MTTEQARQHIAKFLDDKYGGRRMNRQRRAARIKDADPVRAEVGGSGAGDLLHLITDEDRDSLVASHGNDIVPHLERLNPEWRSRAKGAAS